MTCFGVRMSNQIRNGRIFRYTVEKKVAVVAALLINYKTKAFL